MRGRPGLLLLVADCLRETGPLQAAERLGGGGPLPTQDTLYAYLVCLPASHEAEAWTGGQTSCLLPGGRRLLMPMEKHGLCMRGLGEENGPGADPCPGLGPNASEAALPDRQRLP